MSTCWRMLKILGGAANVQLVRMSCEALYAICGLFYTLQMVVKNITLLWHISYIGQGRYQPVLLLPILNLYIHDTWQQAHPSLLAFYARLLVPNYLWRFISLRCIATFLEATRGLSGYKMVLTYMKWNLTLPLTQLDEFAATIWRVMQLAATRGLARPSFVW